ncbi:DUF402 domain-containing protein [Halomarina ordinaria]|uniref:Probable ribonuclease FAU-1 n=1 Tax=Halomarina ordinaria TaxID=3033939 RepID=A0ABD5U8E4_9EURY|nr:DUF402 domain-containing protein [Halomarina sp. PSRA2]
MSEEAGEGDEYGGDPVDPPRVRVRGIYATALTHLLSGDHAVVQASEPIRERFDATFPVEPATVTVETTHDRQGVGLSGPVERVASLAAEFVAVGVDAFVWDDPTPEGAVFDAEVVDTRGGGAVLDLGGNEGRGYLPFDEADGYVETGDALRVQVAQGEPPWSDRDPRCTGRLSVGNGLARLVRGASGGGTSVDLASLLPTDSREGWGVRWDARADDADLDALAGTLDHLNARAERVDASLPEEVGEPGRLTDGRATAWVWFGRECRDALDDHRRAVTTTMPGHHRTKAHTGEASAAVDFAEAVCDPTGPFPFAAVTRQFGPREGDTVALGHGKPDGRLIVLGRGTVTDYDPEGGVTVEREMTPGGRYDALEVERRAGDVAVTKLKEGRWWYATVYRGADGERRGTYVNVCTPVELFPDVARYVDLHVDVVKHADGTVERVDDDELDAAVEAGEVTEPLAEKARQVATAIERALE